MKMYAAYHYCWGIKHNGIVEIFRTKIVPTRESYGQQYQLCGGPWATKGQAKAQARWSFPSSQIEVINYRFAVRTTEVGQASTSLLAALISVCGGLYFLGLILYAGMNSCSIVDAFIWSLNTIAAFIGL